MTIKAVLSDLGNVVGMYQDGTYIGHFENQPSVRKLLPKSDSRLVQLESDLWEIQHRYELGELTELQYRQQISRRLGLSRVIIHGVMHQCFYDIFTLNRQVWKLWNQFKLSGITMVAVSNLCRSHHLTMQRIGALIPFDHEVLSYEEELRKPSKELMIRALDRAGVAAEEAVFIDDLPRNLVPAEELGIKTHQFTGDFKALCDFLTDRGLKIKTEE